MLEQNQTSSDCSTCKEIEERSLQNTAALKGYVSFQAPPFSRLASWRTRARVTPWRSITKDLSSRWSEVSNEGRDRQCIVRLEQCLSCTIKLNSKQYDMYVRSLCHSVKTSLTKLINFFGEHFLFSWYFSERNVLKNCFSNLEPRSAICIQGSVLREEGPSPSGHEEKYQFKDDDCIQTTATIGNGFCDSSQICSDTLSDSSWKMYQLQRHATLACFTWWGFKVLQAHQLEPGKWFIDGGMLCEPHN